MLLYCIGSLKHQRMQPFIPRTAWSHKEFSSLYCSNRLKNQRILFFRGGTAWSIKECNLSVLEYVEVRETSSLLPGTPWSILENASLFCRNSLKTQRMQPCLAGRAWRQRDVLFSSWNSLKSERLHVFVREQLEVSKRVHPCLARRRWSSKEFPSFVLEQREVSKNSLLCIAGTAWSLKEFSSLYCRNSLKSQRIPFLRVGIAWKTPELPSFI